MTEPPQYPGYPDGSQGGYPGGGYPSPGYGQPGYPPPHPGYPPGGYPPPPGYQQPGYPPPPGYQQPPYAGGYPPAPGFGSPPGPPGPPGPQFDIGDALSWAWNKFGGNAAALIVSLLGYAALVFVLGGIWALVVVGMPGADGEVVFTPAQTAGVVVGYVVALVLSMFVQAAYLSGCLDIADGKPVTVGSLYRPRNFGAALVTALLVGLLASLGGMLCVIPGLIVGFLAQFAIAFTIDRSLSPVDSLKASFATCRANLSGALLSWLAQVTLLVVGYLLLGVGLLVGFPLAVLVQTYTYRRLSGGWLAPV